MSLYDRLSGLKDSKAIKLVQARVPIDLYKEVKINLDKMGISFSAFICMSCEQLLEDVKKKKKSKP